MENLKALAYELRETVMDEIMAGKAGHIGGDMSVMEILTELYFRQMNISPENADDPNRDKFVMSKGHSVEAYYAVLAKKGFFDREELVSTFQQIWLKVYRTSEQQDSRNRDELRFPWTRSSSLCGNGPGGKNEWTELPCIHSDGRR